jgi:hypothetical protein
MLQSNINKKTKTFVSFIICSNGYGHLKRVISVVKELNNLKASLNITLFLSRSHYEFAKLNLGANQINNVEFDFSLSETEFSWLFPGNAPLKQYRKWIESVSLSEKLLQSSIIISDNHILPLKFPGKSILMGSFLWPFVKENFDGEIQKIAEEEIYWLSDHTPQLMCVEEMVMKDDLEGKVEIVEMPWFTEEEDSTFFFDDEKPSILITAGGSGSMINSILKIVEGLLGKNENLNIFLDSLLFKRALQKNLKGFHLFDFARLSFQRLAAVICRPGIGILTDCVHYRIPVFALSDGNNREIEHNAFRIRELNIGFYIFLNEGDINQISERILALILNKNKLEACRDSMLLRKTGGARKAAVNIINEIYG